MHALGDPPGPNGSDTGAKMQVVEAPDLGISAKVKDRGFRTQVKRKTLYQN